MRIRWWALAAAGLALTGCAAPTSPEPAPASTPSAKPADPLPTTPVGESTEVRGLDIRYVDADGRVKVLRVEDFPG